MTWSSLVLTYAPLIVALTVPMLSSFEMVESVLLSTFKAVLADHLHPLLVNLLRLLLVLSKSVNLLVVPLVLALLLLLNPLC